MQYMDCLLFINIIYSVQCMHALFNVVQAIHFLKGVNTNLQYMYLEKTNSPQTDPHLGVATDVQFK